MLKQVLGVQKETTNDRDLLEIGMTPLSFDVKNFQLRTGNRSHGEKLIFLSWNLIKNLWN